MALQQLLVRFQDRTHVFSHHVETDAAAESASASSSSCEERIKNFLSQKTGWPCHRIVILPDWQPPFVTCRITSVVRGGKGGFGTLLKGQARQAGAHATTNFGACRDLQGRRLRHINQAVEQRLYREWKEKVEAGTATEVEMAHALLKTDSGVAGWHLQLPAWADVSASKEQRKWQGKFHRWKREREAVERQKAEAKRLQEEQVQMYVQRTENVRAQLQSNLQTALQEGLIRTKKRAKVEVEPPEALLTLAGDVVLASNGEDQWQLQSQSNFCTVGIMVQPAHKYCYYYEVVVITGGLVQVGWATRQFRPCSDTGDGVGDCSQSWAYDGSRQIRLNNGKEHSYGNENWKAGDAIGCLCRDGEISYTINGKIVGVAFKAGSSKMLFPAISCNPGEIVEIHLNSKDFKYPPPSDVTAVGEVLAQDDPASFLVEDDEKEEESSERKQPAQEKSPAEQQAPAPTKTAATEAKPPKSALVIEPLDLDKFQTVKELEALGLDRLKGALMAIQIKCGGTLRERANRLLSLKGLQPEEYPPKLRAKKKKN